jgi:hypothetical protein
MYLLASYFYLQWLKNSQILIYDQLPDTLKVNYVKIDVTTLMFWSFIEVAFYWASTYTS